MFRRIASVVLVLVSLISFHAMTLTAQTATQSEAGPTDTSMQVESTGSVAGSDIADDILTRLDAAVEASVRGVKVGAEFTWPLLVKQQIIEGWLGVAASGLLLLVGIVFGVWCTRLTLDASEIAFPIGVVSFVGVTSGMVGLTAGGGAIGQVLNPEYYALIDVLSRLGL